MAKVSQMADRFVSQRVEIPTEWSLLPTYACTHTPGGMCVGMVVPRVSTLTYWLAPLVLHLQYSLESQVTSFGITIGILIFAFLSYTGFNVSLFNILSWNVHVVHFKLVLDELYNRECIWMNAGIAIRHKKLINNILVVLSINHILKYILKYIQTWWFFFLIKYTTVEYSNV